ncbi:MAG: DNA polymerase Y family protein [Alphaproteobacteria bacterium]|nr:DNA polymerase Y family protein [Alphaproteobacteria bacterium SS10]
MRLHALDEVAASIGLHPDMTLADAKVIAPDLITETAAPDSDRRDLNNLARWMVRFSPWVAIDDSVKAGTLPAAQSTGLWLDVTGVGHLFGGDAALLREMQGSLDRLGLDAHIAMAPTPGAAWALARHSHQGHHRGRLPMLHDQAQIREALGSLNITGLRLSPQVQHDLKRFGLHRIGEVIDLPRDALYKRFDAIKGKSGDADQLLHRIDQALGHVEEPIDPLLPPPNLNLRHGFADPIGDGDTIKAVLLDLLERACEALGHDGLGARALTFTAYRADGGVWPIPVLTGAASTDAKHLAQLFEARVDAIDPGFGIDALSLSIDKVDRVAARQSLLDQSAANDEVAIDRLMDRLRNRLGTGRVTRWRAHESHLPERAEHWYPAAWNVAAQSKAPPSDAPRPIRLFPHPEPVEALAEVPDGPPIRFAWRGTTHRIKRAEGPERIAPEWWDARRALDTLTRDYYRVESEAGQRFWLYREGLYPSDSSATDAAAGHNPRWYLHGLFA